MNSAHSLLIVDAALFMRDLISDSIGNHFEYIYYADSVDTAFTMLTCLSPSLITLDLSMDAQDNISDMRLLKRIRKLGNNTKIVVISEIDQSSVIDQLYDMGISEYIQKPFKPQMLSDTIRQSMGQ